MAQFYQASALNWTPYGADYFNSDRQIIDNNSLSGDFIDSPALSSIKDVVINHETIFYLTDKKKVESFFTNNKETTAFNLSSLPLSADTLALGVSGSSNYVKYYFCNSTPNYNTTTDFREIIPSLDINYILSSPFKTQKDSNAFKFNFMSLKNVMTPYYEYDSCGDIIHRDYQKLYLGTNQKFGYSNMFLGYKSGMFQLTFENNETNYFHYPKDGQTISLSSTCLAQRGAKPGDSPLNSDIIAIDKNGYKNHTSSGNNGTTNGRFLCSWLSGSNSCTCSSIWMERWYDPDNITQGDAYITSVNDNSGNTSIWDIPSDMQLIPKNRYYYDRYGIDRNTAVVDSIDGLILHFNDWKTTLIDQSDTGNDGYIIDDYSGPSSYFELDGNTHAHIPPTDSILVTRNLTVGACVYKDDWCCGKNSQFVGNYHFGGWGLFYNTGMPNNILTVGDDLGNLFSFNIDGTRIFEKEMDKSDELNNISIDYIATDLNGSRWILDSRNNKIYKVDVDDLLTEILDLPISYKLDKLQIDQDNRLYFHDKTNDKVFVHDEIGNYVDTITAPSSATLFELNSDGDVVFDTGDLISIASNGDVYKSWGSNLYKNGEIIFHLNDRIMDMKIDESDNLWIIYCGDILLKINPKDELVLKRKVTKTISGEKNSKIGLTRKTNINGCDENRIWIVFEDSFKMAEVSPIGETLQIINTVDYIVKRNCEDYTLRALGDFTGFDINRKFELAGAKNISPTNPAITLRIKFKDSCNTKLFKAFHIPACNFKNGWHHISMSFDSNAGDLKFFIDGVVVGQSTLDSGRWSIDYNEITPIIIGGNSGKLGSENVEKSIIDDQYFQGRINDIRVFNKTLTEFTIKALSDYKLGTFEDLIWNVQISDKNLIEKVDTFFMNKKPGYVSNKFNIKINGLGVSDDLKLLIEESVISSIENIIPKYTEINDIVWG